MKKKITQEEEYKMEYTVTNEANSDIEVFDTLEDANEYINAELVLINLYEKPLHGRRFLY